MSSVPLPGGRGQDHSAPFMTSPLPESFSDVLPTGNEYVALPDIGPDGSIGSIHLLSMRALGLLGFRGAPLLRPFLGSGGLPPPAWERLDHWIPTFRWLVGDLTLTETIVAPVGHKGFFIVLRVQNRGGRAQVAFGLDVSWDEVTYTLFSTRPLPAVRGARSDPWTRGVVMEALAGLPLAGWAIHAQPEVELPPASGAAAPLAFRLGRNLTLDRDGSAVEIFYVGVGAEGDAARTTAVDLRRRGWEALLAQTRRWLAERTSPGEDRATERHNLNLLFNYFFATGRTIDTEELVWVTSRSPRYYVSAAFWSRDAFLWSLPALIRADPATAREAVLFAFRTQWRNAGMHAQYINGAIIYPGFELDQLAAFPVGLGHYLRATGDISILQAPEVLGALLEYPTRLAGHRRPCGLLETFLDPSDDPVLYPFLTYDNVLAWRGLVETAEALERLAGLGRKRAGRQPGRFAESTARLRDTAERARGLAAELARCIWELCVVDGPNGAMFAWAVDGKGAFQLYDTPPGSLLLLPYYEFCAAEHPVYANTASWIRSAANPAFASGRFGAAGSMHSPGPWPMAAANDLLTGRREALQFLCAAPMDGGIACESVDPSTGRVKTGAAFATCAGLLAHALAPFVPGGSS